MFAHQLGRRGPGRYIAVGSRGGGESDPGFPEPPVVTTTAAGDTTVKGKVKPGSFGKFVFPLATLTAGRQYTFRYTPNFSQLAQQGKLAMVGFGLKNGNDFHIVGLRGDGTTGLNKYKVYGTNPNGWNKETGHTTSDGGAAAHGTQAGPNYIRLVVSADGATYTFKSSADGVTWTDEYTGATPSPFSNVSGVTTFGMALWFSNADSGQFSIVIDQFADVLADPYFANVVLLCGFNGVDGATTTVDESPSPHTMTFVTGSIVTAQSKFGGASLNGRVTTPDSANWDMSDNNADPYTIEAWIRPSSIAAGSKAIVSQYRSTGSQLAWTLRQVADAMSFTFSTNGSGIVGPLTYTPSGDALVVGTWYHVAVDKDATGKIRLYLDGVMKATSTPANSTIFNSTADLTISADDGGSNPFAGHIDELRITKGVARYASDSGFTVPAAAYPRQ